MTLNFRRVAGDAAGDRASVGRGKLALVSDERGALPLLRIANRDFHSGTLREHDALARLVDQLALPGDTSARSLATNYYISLKSNPFVILTGPEGYGKLAFVQRFAGALLGEDGRQYAIIPGAAPWTNKTGEDRYYRSLHERFTSWRFLDLLQEAAAPGNLGKLYLVCFSRLHPGELDYYFSTLLSLQADGQKRLNLPGFPTDRRPIVPPNLLITATLDVAEGGKPLSAGALRNAGVIEFRPWREPHGAPALPPVGYQRLWLRSALHDLSEARRRLGWILGRECVGRLRCSPWLTRMLWQSGTVLSSHMLEHVTIYVANSFDAEGRGLFDPENPERNAQIAYDSQVIQRVLWRLHGEPGELRDHLSGYLDDVGRDERQRAVA